MERSLRRLQVVSRDEVLVLVTWEDLSVPLAMGLEADGRALPWADHVTATRVGLVAVRTRGIQTPQVTARITRPADGVTRTVPVQVTVIRYDGKRMRVGTQQGKVGPESLQLAVKLP